MIEQPAFMGAGIGQTGHRAVFGDNGFLDRVLKVGEGIPDRLHISRAGFMTGHMQTDRPAEIDLWVENFAHHRVVPGVPHDIEEGLDETVIVRGRHGQRRYFFFLRFTNRSAIQLRISSRSLYF